MTSIARQTPVVASHLPSLSFPHNRFDTANASPDLLARASQAARHVWRQGSIPRHLLLTRATDIRVLPDVNAAYQAMATLIRQADHELLMQNYVWDDDTHGARNVLRAIRARCADVVSGSKPPLVLRIVIHHRGRRTLPTACKFSSARLEAFIRALDPACIRAELAYAHNHTFGADLVHSKNVIADGREVLFIGTNFNKHNDPPDAWYDNGLHLTGQTALAARADWCHVRADRHTRLRACNGRLPAPLELPNMPSADGRATPVLVVSHLARRWLWHTRATEANPQDQSVLSLLRNAQRSIDIITPCVNVPSVREALAQVVLRGVRVRYITSLNMDSWGQRYFRGGCNADNAHALVKSVLARGGPEAAQRLHIAWSSFDGVTRPKGKTHGTSHAKNICIDGHVLMVGSMNLDWQSWNNSRELSCIVDDAKVSEQWRNTVFDKRWACAVPMEAHDLPWWHRHRANRAFRYLRAKGKNSPSHHKVTGAVYFSEQKRGARARRKCGFTEGTSCCVET